MNFQDKRPIVEKGSYDVVVVGGGVAGVAAALAASRQGASTLIIEKTITFGGLATIGLISWYEPICDRAGTQMMSGLAEELLRTLIVDGIDNLDKGWKEENKPSHDKATFTSFFSPCTGVMVLDEILKKNNVDIRLDSLATYPVMEGKHCRGVVVETKGGKEFFEAKVVIDCTGDADVFHAACAPTEEGFNYISYITQGTDYEKVQKYIETKNVFDMDKWNGVGSTLSGQGHPEWAKKVAGTSCDDITYFVLTGREMFLEKYRKTDKNLQDIFRIPMIPQFRTTRHIVGQTVFDGTVKNIKYDDAIGWTGDFRTCGDHYQLPYSMLYCEGFDNLLAAGRMVSATGEGWQITRVIPTCVLTGEAAGRAAALAVKSGVGVDAIDVKELQAQLKESGAYLELDF